ncbi:MAG: NBR1-Ig-like domain-containing protein [Anaerolineales bacterium]
MANQGKKILIWSTVLILISACVLPSVGAPVVPTIDPGAVNTFIAQTANAAATQTSRALPTSTPTETATATPRPTSTNSPTPTNTVIFILKSPTPIVPPTIPGSGSGGGSSASGYSCEVVTTYPFGVTFSPRTNFDATWKVKNTGSQSWDRNSVDFVYSSGDQIHKVAGYDLDQNVKVGQSITLSVSMQAPKSQGTYTTRWILKVAGKTICTMVANITVQ